MVFEEIILNAHIFLIIFVRITAMVMVAPLLSSNAIPTVGKIGLSFFVTMVILPWVAESGYPVPDSGLLFGLILLGEILIGLLTGFFLNMIYAAFQLAGQLFSLQMGFAASQVFDPLSQIQIPLIGQFLNLIAMFVVLSVKGVQKIFLVGVYRSFQAFNILGFMERRETFFQLLLTGMVDLFSNALIVALPLIGTLFLVSITIGLLAKAAPQMNLLMLGFPLNIGIAFMLLLVSLPMIMEFFGSMVDIGFMELSAFFRPTLSGGTQ